MKIESGIMHEARGLQIKIDIFAAKIKGVLLDPKISLVDKEALMRSTSVQVMYPGCYPDLKLKNGCELSWYDEFYTERGVTVSIVECLDIINERWMDDEKEEDIDFVIIQLLSIGCTHFVYYW